MIPKKIHYCWFGGKPLSKEVLFCINSWKKYMPEFEIIEWNESNFNVNQYQFAKEALDSKKYAFVSDVCRLHVLYENGGIYLDTDVEVLKPFNELLNTVAFVGFETEEFICTAIMASEKKGEWIADLLKYYNNKSFYNADGTFDTTPNPKIVSSIMSQKELKLTNNYQEIKNYVTVYPTYYFSPKNYFTGKTKITKDSFSIHHFNSTWMTGKQKTLNKIKVFLIRIFGEKIIFSLIRLIKK